MAFGDVTVTVVGNLAGDPELRFTPSGAAVCNFTVAKNKRKKQGDQWVDAGTDWYRVNCWRQLAENLAESLRKGDRVIVTGKLESRDFETREGEKRTSWEVTAESAGPDLSWATAQVRKADRQQGGQNGYQQSQGQQQGGYQPQDPWTQGQQQPAYQGAPQGQQQMQYGQQQGAPPANDPWSSEPPF